MIKNKTGEDNDDKEREDSDIPVCDNSIFRGNTEGTDSLSSPVFCEKNTERRQDRKTNRGVHE